MLLGGFSLFPVALLADTDAALKKTEKAATEWVNLRLESSRLNAEWDAQRPLLESLVKGLKERVGTLEMRKEHLQAKTAKDREETAAVQAEIQSLGREIQTMETKLQQVSAQLIALRPQLPPRLSDALEMAYRSLATSTLTVNERMQLLTTVLNRCVQFNRTITHGQETVQISAAEKKLLNVIYWGLGQAYALDRSTNRAWAGRPGSAGWTWEQHDEAAPAIARLFDVYEDKADPESVSVPAAIVNPALSK